MSEYKRIPRTPRNRGFERVSEMQWAKDIDGLKVVGYNSILLPKRSTMNSAGYDIFSTSSFFLNPKQSIKIMTGIKAYMLKSEFLLVAPRSGMGFKYFVRLANTVGIVDSDFYNNVNNEGHISIKIRNESDEEILSVKEGDAIAQCIFILHIHCL